MSGLLSRIICHVVEYLYPAYKTYKAVELNDDSLYTQWLTYWIVNTCFYSVEFFFDLLLPIWIPFYLQLKVVFFLWLSSPHSNGASLIYNNLLHPYFVHYENDIDDNVSKFKQNVTAQMSTFGQGSIQKVQASGFEYFTRALTQISQIQNNAEIQRRQSVQNAVERDRDNLTEEERRMMQDLDSKKEQQQGYFFRRTGNTNH